jgi:hypothetical protein
LACASVRKMMRRVRMLHKLVSASRACCCFESLH